MRVFLELIRIILIFLLVGSLLAFALNILYLGLNINTEKFGFLATLGIYMFLFVFYRNRWQFSGWYKGRGREKLPKEITRILVGCALLFVLSPIFLSII